MIGFQAEFRENARRDGVTVERLRNLVSNPPPGTLFLPLLVETHGASTGRGGFDRAIHGVFDTPWSCRVIVNLAYQRIDVNAAPVPLWIRNLDTRGFTFLHLPGVITWDRCVPFIVRATGEVCLVRRLKVSPGHGKQFLLDFPRIAPAISANDTGSIQLREVNSDSDDAHAVTDVP
jgi:hypothetical protein